MHSKNYLLLDSGYGQRLEQFGELLLIRPCAQAVWPPALPKEMWDGAHAIFDREGGKQWTVKGSLPATWNVCLDEIWFKLKRTDFGHLGIFPEHASQWDWMRKQLQTRPGARVLNLFAYSGGTTLAAAQCKAHVCHVDAAKGMVDWARENAALNQLEKCPIRWIVDDVRKFLAREIRREERYEGIILDPPTFGRGKSGEVFKIETDLQKILQQCVELLSENPLFLLFSCHTPGYTPLVMEQVLKPHLKGGVIESGEMVLTPVKQDGPFFILPTGTFARWSNAG